MFVLMNCFVFLLFLSFLIDIYIQKMLLCQFFCQNVHQHPKISYSFKDFPEISVSRPKKSPKNNIETFTKSLFSVMKFLLVSL